jgi:uncharacterized membrane protein YphA (DoxX/SURF4 family)
MLYVVVLVTLLFAGGGRLSVDAKLSARFVGTKTT